MSSRRLRTRGQEGFSVVEVLVAMSLLIVGVLGVFGLFTKSQESATTAHRHEVALQQAEQALEEVRALPYGQVTLSGPPPLPLTTPDGDDDVTNDDEPADRISGGWFRPRDGAPEELVLTGDPAAGEGPAAVAPHSTVQVGQTGGGPLTMHVYRFVSWRDEECTLVTTKLAGALTDLRATVSGLAGENGSITLLLERIDAALVSRDALLNGPVASLLSAAIRPLLNQVLTTLDPIAKQLDPILAALEPLLTQIDAALAVLVDPVTNRIDVCDLEALQSLDFSDIESLNETLTAVGAAVDALFGPVNGGIKVIQELNRLNIFNAVVVLGKAVAELPVHLAGIVTASADLTQALAAFAAESDKTLVTALEGLTESLTTLTDFLVNQPDHQKNTKRVTVAVVLDRAVQANVGPMKPIWVSTVVTDPKAGLL